MIAVVAVALAFHAALQQDTSMKHMHHPGMQTDTSMQMQEHDMSGMTSRMLMAQLGDFSIMAMAQAVPTFTAGLPARQGTPLDHSGVYVTQPALMAHIANHDGSLALHTTLNAESFTQPHGELSYGAWGEGYIDKRHPHTLLHELMLSWSRGTATKGFSISGGKGFAPYGTDDPMSRPVVKYPTNHHLSQVLERWVVSGVAAYRTWGFEAGLFGGDEPTGPYDLGNYHHFGNSWSARLTRRLGAVEMARSPTEISASFASVTETHASGTVHSRLYNAAIRQEHHHQHAQIYGLLEASRRTSDEDDPYYSFLGEGAAEVGRHQPYARVEFSTRPEYAREGTPDSDKFFRYDHDLPAAGATRWMVLTGGYGHNLSDTRLSLRPYVEVQYNRIAHERGAIDLPALYGRSSFWSISAGARIFLGGESMRMGTYGVLDPMRAMHEMPPMHDMPMHHMSEHEH